MSAIVIGGDTSGTITLQAPAVAGSTTINLPAISGTLLTTGNTGQVTSPAIINANPATPAAGSITGTNLWTLANNSTPNVLLMDGFGPFSVPNIIGRRSQGTAASPTAVSGFGVAMLTLSGRAYGATGYSTADRAQMTFQSNEAWSDTAQGTYIAFQATPNGTTATTPVCAMYGNGDFQFNSGYGNIATAYGCRAWVNFNGTGTVAIRASGNVSSITDNGTGDYTVNLTNAMPDINYSYNVSNSYGASWCFPTINRDSSTGTIAPTTTAFRFVLIRYNASAYDDAAYINVSVFR